MIARRIPMRNASKSRVVRLAKYLEDKKSSSRVQDVTITGCYSPDVEGAALEMMAVQAENRQAKSDKTYHLIISFREGERPDRFARRYGKPPSACCYQQDPSRNIKDS